MNAEFCQKINDILGSPYWDVVDEEEWARLRNDEWRPLKLAAIELESYDELPDDMKAIWDRAEHAIKVVKGEIMNADLAEGWARFLEQR